MATTAMDYENANGDRFEEDAPRYDRDRSASPRRDDGPDDSRRRSMSPNGHDRAPAKESNAMKDDDALNPGSNLFVTGIHPRLTEEEVTRLFEKYGEVEKCQIMKDPHTLESRGFGFVKMVTPDMADAARDGLQGEMIEGRTLSIEKARRSRPRTPTPGKYFGPPKREGGGRGGRFDDRRPRGGYGGGYRDDYNYRGARGGYREDRGYGGGSREYGGRDYDRSYDRGGYREDRGYDRGYREERGYDREERGYRGGGASGGGYDRRGADRGDDSYGSRIDRYAGGREERYGGRGGDDRRGGGAGYDRERFDRTGDRDARPRDAGAASGGYADAPPRAEASDSYGTR